LNAVLAAHVGPGATPIPTTAAQAALAALLGATPANTQPTASAGSHHSSGKDQTTVITQLVPRAPSVIQQIEQVVPSAIWIALAVALMLAAAAAASALWSRRRIRHQAGELTKITAAAVTDPLTGLLNRRGFNDAVERELARARRYDRQFVLAYIDVRGMKAVNDSEGHRAGDELLCQAAQLLQDSARANDVVARLGGDEMGVMLVELGEEGAATVRERIEANVQERREAMALRSPWDLTVGIATFPSDGDTVDQLMSTADRRLYEQRGIELIYDSAFDDRR
jgi:diguanylate cyclase (GGDEF)-like protein